MVTVSIIGLLSIVVFANYRAGEKQFALQRSAHKLAQDIRRAQSMAMEAASYDCGVGWIMKGYGINLIRDNDYYLLKVRCEDEANPGSYDNRTIGDPINLEEGVKIFSLTTTPLNIFFYPPDPETDLEEQNEIEITLASKTDTSKTKKIRVNKAGLIEIE
jgi:Tfp pilus assembly protein FimT